MSKERLITLEKQHCDLKELAGVFLENGVDEIEKRINPYQLNFDNEGKPEFECENESELGKAEYEGMKSIWKLAREKYKYIFWLSPSGGRSEYEDGRVVVGIVVDNQKIKINCRGIPIFVEPDELLMMANKIIELGGNSVNRIEEVEDLREQALGVNLDFGCQDEFWDFCGSIFGMDKVWNEIKNGNDITRKEEIELLVDEALSDIRFRFGEFNENNSIYTGALLERMMEFRGYQIEGGNHGGLNSDLLGSSFDKLYSNSEIMVKAEIRDGKRYCPCGTELKDGSSICPTCGLKISNSED